MLLAKSTFLKHRQSILEIIHKLPVIALIHKHSLVYGSWNIHLHVLVVQFKETVLKNV